MKKRNTILSIMAVSMLMASLSACAFSSQSANIKVTVSSLVDKPLANVSMKVMDSAGNLVNTFTTSADGSADIAVKGDCKIVLDNLPKGYVQKDEIRVNGNTTSLDIKVPTSVIMEDTPAETLYQIGDVVYDFELKDCYGTSYKVSDVLKEKDMILVNFWATWCGPCVGEFPFMEEAYEAYSENVEILAFSSSDTQTKVKGFKETNGLTFPMGFDEYNVYEYFNAVQFPTSIIIDRYGMVNTIELGALASTSDFIELFDRFIGDDYTPILAGEDGKFHDYPDVAMPSSDELRAACAGEGFDGEFEDESNPDDAEMNWPWVVSEDGQSIRPSNSRHANSYSIVYTSITLDENQVFAFDYKADTEYGCDVLYVLVDRKIVQQISGTSRDWETCFCYVPTSQSTHEVAFAYIKDSAANAGTDTVLLKNLRIVSTDRIDQPTLIYHDAAYDYNEADHTYDSYVSPVYNQQDGYFHVGSPTGPYLLANLMSDTLFSGTSILEYTGVGRIDDIDIKYRSQIGKYSQLILEYSSYQNNSEVGLVPVTADLKNALVDITRAISNNGANEWLEVCGYLQAFAMPDIDDPIAGLAPFSAFEGRVGENFVEFNRLIMPRGLFTRFVPEESGVYYIHSFSPDETYVYETACWIMDSNMQRIRESDFGERYYMMSEEADPNCRVYAYLEAGETYYINMAFANLGVFGYLPFMIEFTDLQELDLLTLASPNFFTTTLDESGEMTQNVIAGGIDVALGDDGYYHHLMADGTLGSILYCDFSFGTGILQDARANNLSLIDVINMGGFNFALDELGNPVPGVNKTNDIKPYLDKMITTGELTGMVAVDEGLAELLQMLMDKYTFKDVPHSWTKLCYYYLHIDSTHR